MDTEKIDFIESMTGENPDNDSKKKNQGDANMAGVDLDGVSPAVKSWFIAKKEKHQLGGKEV